MTTGLATPENTALTAAARRDPAADGVDHRPQRRAELDLADVGRDDVADDGGDDRAGRLGGAHRAEPVGAPGEDVRHVRQRLDVVDQRRVRLVASPAVRRAGRPPTPPAVTPANRPCS